MFYNITLLVIRFFIRIIFFPKITGMKNIPETGGYILASNHRSNYDPLLVVPFIKGKQCILAKEELLRNPIANWFLKSVGAIALKRGASDVAAFKKSISVLKQGRSLLIFPQGTRGRTAATETDAKAGVALIAVKAGVPIVPIGIHGSYKWFKRMYVNIGEPIWLDDCGGRPSAEQLRDMSGMVFGRIKELAGAKLEM